jgi:hypothetical protein
MNATWMTKHGKRSVRHDPPTLEEALFAAQGLMMDMRQQINFAADLMQLPIDQVRAEAERWFKQHAPTATTAPPQAARRLGRRN